MSQVRGFREIVGPDGNVTYEFASDADDSESSEDVDYVPPAAALARRNAIPNLDIATDWAENLGLMEVNVSESSNVSIASSSGLSESDPDPANPPVGPEIPGPSNRIAPAVRENNGLVPRALLNFTEDSDFDSDSDASDLDPPYPTPSNYVLPPAARTRSRKGIPRRTGRRRKQAAPKKKKIKRPRAPPKPLVPLTIRRDKICHGDNRDIKKCFYPHKVSITKTTDEQPEKGWKIGQLELVLQEGIQLMKEDGTSHPFSAEPATVFQDFPGFLTLQFSVHNEKNILLLKQEKRVPEDVAKDIPAPPGPKYRNRVLNYIDVEHYYYLDFELRGDLLVEHLAGLRSKAIRLEFKSYSANSLAIDLLLLESSIMGEHDLLSIPRGLPRQKRIIFSFLFGVDIVEGIEPQEKEDIEWFYGQVQKYHKSENLAAPPISLQHPSMNPILRDYQKDAVQWMLFKEGVISAFRGSSEFTSIKKASEITAMFLEKMFAPVQLEDITQPLDSEHRKRSAFYNPYVGYFCWSRPEIPPIPSGGILADEMGLGKTVEILALILLHPCRDLEEEKPKFVNLSSEEEDSALEPSPSESDSSESSESASSYDEPRKKRKKKKKAPVKVTKKKVVSRKRKKRSPSPCEFVAHNFEGDEHETVNTTEAGQAVAKRKRKLVVSSDDEMPSAPSRTERVSYGDNIVIVKERRFSTASDEGRSMDSDPVAHSSQSPPAKARKSNSKDEKPAGPMKTYDRVKVLYDAALSEYSACNVSRPKFYGTFFETTIKRQAGFECLCGEGVIDRRKTISCTNCLSSQHVDCVNFDLRKRRLSTYLCPHCEVSAPPTPVKTTLIVTPTTISYQWINEIQKHIKNKHLRILYYKGVSKHGYFPPYKFAEYDLVITSYSVLAADLNYVDLPHTNSEAGRKFRHVKRFLTTPSSLPAVYWWRVCLDEAQMVEGIATKMAQMAQRLQGVHRWCITGTPLNKGLEDLYGLISFLGVSPVSEEVWWEYLVRVPFFKKDTSLLFEFFGQLIWRTGKRAVLNQLGIPKQTEAFHWLQFSPVEMHFYRRQYETCSSKIMAKISRLKQLNGASILQCRLSSLDRQTLHSLLQPFLELRQACCHPQMVRGNVISLQKLKGTMTMEDLLDQLIKKTKIQCADDHRLVVAALNGLAGLFLLINRWADAAEKYRDVLQSAEKHKDKFSTDSLQLLHALENLADVLDGAHADVGFTCNDDKLRPQAEEIRKKYLEKYATSVKAAQDAVDPITTSVMDLMESFICKKESWWFSVLRRAVVTSKDAELIDRIKEDLTYKAKLYKKKSNSIANSFRDTAGLQFLMIEKIQELEESRDNVLGGLQELSTRGPAAFVEGAVFCHLRGQTQTYYKEKHSGYRCDLCQYHDRFLDYEALLFSTVENIKVNRTGRNRQMANFAAGNSRELTSEERAMVLMREEEELIETTEHVNLNMLLDQRRQTWADSDVEKIIKALLGFARLNGCSIPVLDDGANHVKLFEAMKKEFRLLRILWRQIYDQVSAIDELSQATTRLRIQTEADGDDVQRQRTPKKSTIKSLSSGISEKADKIMNIHVLHRHEVDLKIEQIQQDYEMGKDSLSIHLGQLIYLDSLHKNGYGQRGAFNHDDCPVCANALGHQWCVLICGHSYCTECIKTLCERNSAQSFLCPLCRASMKMATVSFIDTRQFDSDENGGEAGPSTSTAVLPATKPVEVKGSHSTKVESVVETLLRLQESHPGEKCLVFSTWTDVLEIISQALEQNDIKYCMLVSTAKVKFHEVLDRFKKREDIQVLLIPLQSGSKGLNLIEASHVLLVEPIFNIASELQAIGRVHRIGQTKPTFVHRFYVKNTIEEQLFEILKGHDVSSDEEGLLTLSDLQKLIMKGGGGQEGNSLGSAATVETIQLG